MSAPSSPTRGSARTPTGRASRISGRRWECLDPTRFLAGSSASIRRSTAPSARCSSRSSRTAASVRWMAQGDAADLVTEFALPVPSLVIAALLGVPSGDRGFFESRTRTLVAIRTSTDSDREIAARELLRYINRLIALREKWPGDDLISRLLATGAFGRQDLSGALLLLLIAGHETTANNIALGAMTLLMHPEWIGDERVVEELLRLHSVADLVAPRVATQDVEIAGQLIRAGEGIMPLVAAANHDEDVFKCPHEFNPARPTPQHVAFGYGAHQCLGQNLVRVELEIAYRTLFERIPKLQLAAPVEQLPFKYDGVIFGLHELPVSW